MERICPFCEMQIKDSDSTQKCSECGKVYHKECWDVMGGCNSHNNTDNKSQSNNNSANNQESSDLIFCTNCGKQVSRKAFVCPSCGVRVFDGENINNNSYDLLNLGTAANKAEAYKKLAEYEKISGYIWLAIGIVQCLSLVGIICGVWNIVVATQRLKYSKELETGSAAGVYDVFENQKSSIIVMLIVNIIFGALIGIIGAIFDLVVRNYVMQNAAVFKSGYTAQTSTGKTAIQQGNVSNSGTNDSAAINELKKYKELLDMGAITQSEFDAKKKEILNI